MEKEKGTEAKDSFQLHFLKSTDRINRVMQKSHDLETMMSDVLDEVLVIFDCDRAALVYPCDPASSAWTARMERTRTECPGTLALGIEVPTEPEAIRVFKTLLDADAPVRFGPESPYPLPAKVAERFNIRSQIAMAIYPKGDKPWTFVLHQCSYPRVWTDEETRLFQEIGRRLADNLTSLLSMRDLRTSEERLRSIFDAMDEGAILQEKGGKIVAANPRAGIIFGLGEKNLAGRMAPDISRSARVIHEDGSYFVTDDLPSRVSLRTGQPQRNVTMGIHQPDGALVWISVNSQPLIAEGQREPYAVVVSFHDISGRKRTEAALKRSNRELQAIGDCNQALLRAVNEPTLLNDVCQIICDKAGYRMAWVGFAEHDEFKTVRPMAWAGSEYGYLANANITWADVERGQGPTGTAIRSGQSTVIQDFAADPKAALWRVDALQRGFRSSIALPLKDESAQTFGALNIYSTEPNTFTPEETRLLEGLAGDLAYGIVSLRARAESKRTEQELIKANEQLRIAATAFESQEGIVVTDAAQTILRVNRAFIRITGYSEGEAVGRTPRLLRSGRHDSGFYRTMWELIRAEGAWQGEIWNRRKNGEIYLALLSISAVCDEQGTVTHYVGTILDITARKEAEREIEYLAFYDPLTRLPNRRLLVDRLQQALASGARDGRQRALLFIDLDNFKVLNDSFGHGVGDRLLMDVADRLSTCVRKGDTVARLGGDEFVALLEDLSEHLEEAATRARNVASKILARLGEPYSIGGREHRSTASLGITLFVDNGMPVEELLKQADIAMYQAKSAGRNTFSFFDPVTQAALASRAELEAMLHVAIRGAQFVLYYQPQFDVSRGIIGAEALVRWEHPERGLMQPDQFIPLSEESRLILDIGQWLLDTAATVLSDWAQDPATRDLRLSVNISARQFLQLDFVEQVRIALNRTGAPASRLKIELTERVMLEDIKGTGTKMRALKDLGVGFSLDDFGTGYSSLSYLTQLPLDELKIDRSFIRNLPDSPNDAAVVQTIIALAKALDLKVIAEGVESEAQSRFLQEEQCPIYQGFLFSEPVTLTRFEQLL